MDVEERAQRQVSIVERLSPLIAGMSLAILPYCLWRASISLPYLMFAIGFGLGCALLAFFTRLKNHLNLTWAIFPTLTIIVQTIARYVFFGVDPNAWSWKVAFQFFGFVFLTFCGTAWMFRKRIISSLLKPAVPQVGP